MTPRNGAAAAAAPPARCGALRVAAITAAGAPAQAGAFVAEAVEHILLIHQSTQGTLGNSQSFGGLALGLLRRGQGLRLRLPLAIHFGQCGGQLRDPDRQLCELGLLRGQLRCGSLRCLRLLDVPARQFSVALARLREA